MEVVRREYEWIREKENNVETKKTKQKTKTGEKKVLRPFAIQKYEIRDSIGVWKLNSKLIKRLTKKMGEHNYMCCQGNPTGG